MAYVGAFTNAAGRLLDINRPVNALYMFGNPANLFNGNALDTNFLRRPIPAWEDQQVDRSEEDGDNVNARTLQLLDAGERPAAPEPGPADGAGLYARERRGWTGWSLRCSKPTRPGR